MTLAGLEIGLLTMRKGEFARFLFQPRYAYGSMGCPPLIPPAAVILYEIQILDFLDSGQVDNFLAMSPVGKASGVPWVSLSKNTGNPTRHRSSAGQQMHVFCQEEIY